jgi:uncharacterized SAM-binding protein YcdF (DUF218 family)
MASNNSPGVDAHAGSCLAKILKRLMVLGLAGLLLVVSVITLLRSLGSFLIVSDNPQKTEAVAVLSGGDISRIKEGARVLRELKGDYFIITETGYQLPEIGYSNTLNQKLEAHDLGVPSTAMLVTEQQVRSTLDEAKAVRQLAEAHGIKSVVVVTEPYHSYRTKLIFSDVFKGSEIKLAVQPVRGHWFRSETWFLSPKNWQLVVNEYFKLAGYLMGRLLK